MQFQTKTEFPFPIIFIFTLLIFTILLFGRTASVFAFNATLSWDSEADPNLAGYKVYYGSASRSYGAPIVIGKQNSYTVTGLGPETYYFALTAYTTSAVESSFSNEIRKTFSEAPPVILSIRTSNTSGNSTTIAWVTDKPSDSQIQYGATASYGSSTPIAVSLGLAHSLSLKDLSPSTTYHFRVLSRDAAGNLAASSDHTFTTAAETLPVAIGDTAPPVLSAIASVELTDTGATITWSTDEPATTEVEYGTTSLYGAASALDTALSTNHSATLLGLTPATTYHYQVKSADPTGNLAISADTLLTTPAASNSPAPISPAASPVSQPPPAGPDELPQNQIAANGGGCAIGTGPPRPPQSVRQAAEIPLLVGMVFTMLLKKVFKMRRDPKGRRGEVQANPAPEGQ